MASNLETETVINALSPMVYWKMNETSGTTLAQSGSSTAAALTLYGTYTLANDELIAGDAARFIRFGTDGWGFGTKGDIATPVQETSVSFLMKINADFLGYDVAPYVFTLGTTGETSATNVQTSMRFLNTNRAISTFYETGSGGDREQNYGLIDPNNFYSSNTVYHIAITRGPDELIPTTIKEKIYVNGIFKAIGERGYPSGGGSAKFYVNTIWDNRVGFDISLGHFAIWDRALTREEVYSISEASGYNTYASTLAEPDPTNNTYWGTYNTIQSNLKQDVTKLLSIPLDPLVDQTIINPEDSYETTQY